LAQRDEEEVGTMRPKLRPRKGYRYRIILCDFYGNVVYDDFGNPYTVDRVALKLMLGLLEKQKFKPPEAEK